MRSRATDKVQQIKEIIVENAKQEFRAIWQCNKDGIKKAWDSFQPA